MEWYLILLIVILIVLIFFFVVGLLFFLYMCKPDREKSGSLDGAEGRALQSYVPKIKEYALKNAKHNHKAVAIKSFDGLTLRAKEYVNTRKKDWIILVHGYHSSSSWDFGASFEMYYEQGLSILALDDRAHGSEGKYIGFGALDSKDVESWMDWIIKQYGEECRIALVGVSMGAATVMMVTGHSRLKQLKCVIEDCGYTSLKEVVAAITKKKHIPLIPLYYFTSFWSKVLAGYYYSEANPEKAVSQSTVPILFIHGDKDGFVPFYMLDRLYNKCAAEKEKVVFEDAVHGESSYKYPDRYKKTVVSFLNNYIPE